MPNIKSAIKRVKTTNKKTLQNRMKKSALRTNLRSFNETIESKAPVTQDMLNDVLKRVDQAASKNLLHKNAASRKKAQLQKAFNAISAE